MEEVESWWLCRVTGHALSAPTVHGVTQDISTSCYWWEGCAQRPGVGAASPPAIISFIYQAWRPLSWLGVLGSPGWSSLLWHFEKKKSVFDLRWTRCGWSCWWQQFPPRSEASDLPWKPGRWHTLASDLRSSSVSASAQWGKGLGIPYQGR